MEIHALDPLSDGRWDELVRHPGASVFHERGWLEALGGTYRYEPFVLTSAPPGEPLENPGELSFGHGCVLFEQLAREFLGSQSLRKAVRFASALAAFGGVYFYSYKG